MSIQHDWSQHILIRSLCDPKMEKVNKKVFAELSPELFISEDYIEAYNRIDAVFAKQGRLLTWKELVTDPTLKEETRRRLRAKEVKRKSSLELDASLSRPRNYEEYQSLCQAVLNRARHSSLISLHNELAEGLKETMTEEEVNSLVVHTRDSLASLESLSISKGKLFKVSTDTVKDRFNQFYKQLQDRMFIPTGYSDFDKVNMGIPRDSLWIIAGKTGSGKSSLAIDVLMNMKKAGARVCLLPLEMSVEQMLIRMGARLIEVPANEIVADFKKYGKEIIKALDDFLKIEDNDPSCFHFYEPEVDETLDVSLKTLAVQNYDIIAVDYINLMSPMGGEEGWQALNIAGRYAKRFASSNKTCILFLVQLDDTTNEVRYSRALKEHGSNMWTWSENLYEIIENGYITIKQPKARNQNPITFKLRADLRICKYGDYIETQDSFSKKNNNFSNKKFYSSSKKKGKKSGGFDDDIPNDYDV